MIRACLLCLLCVCAFADQLAWVTKAQADAALAHFKAGQLVVSYCSLANNAPFEVWRVRDVVICPVDDEGSYYQVGLFVEVLLVAPKALRSSADYHHGMTLQPAPVAKSYAFHYVDLAYVYSSADNTVWKPVGRVLGFDCDVEVAEIRGIGL